MHQLPDGFRRKSAGRSTKKEAPVSADARSLDWWAIPAYLFVFHRWVLLAAIIVLNFAFTENATANAIFGAMWLFGVYGFAAMVSSAPEPELKRVQRGLMTGMLLIWAAGLSIHVADLKVTVSARAAKEHEALETAARPAKPSAREKVVWDNYSDGWTWYSATHEERMELCNRLASESYNASSAQFFYDAFQEFYTTAYNEPNTKSQKINDMARLFQAGGNALPRGRRNY